MTKALFNGQPVGEYVYDSLGRRVKKIAYGATTNYVYDQFGSLIAEADSSGNITREYIYLNGRPLALVDLPLPSTAPPPTITQQVSRGCSSIFVWDPGEGIFGYVLVLSPFFFLIFFRFTRSKKKSFILLIGFLGAGVVFSFLAVSPSSLPAQPSGSEVVYFYHLDHLGTPVRMTDSSGTVVWTWQYGPFGEEPLTMANTINQNLRFPGQYYDAETGLNYNFFRYYHPTLGRYLTSDPALVPNNINKKFPFIYASLENPASLHNYYYGANNPLRFFDTLGLCPCSDVYNRINNVKNILDQLWQGNMPQGQPAAGSIFLVPYIWRYPPFYNFPMCIRKCIFDHEKTHIILGPFASWVVGLSILNRRGWEIAAYRNELGCLYGLLLCCP